MQGLRRLLSLLTAWQFERSAQGWLFRMPLTRKLYLLDDVQKLKLETMLGAGYLVSFVALTLGAVGAAAMIATSSAFPLALRSSHDVLTMFGLFALIVGALELVYRSFVLRTVLKGLPSITEEVPLAERVAPFLTNYPLWYLIVLALPLCILTIGYALVVVFAHNWDILTLGGLTLLSLIVCSMVALKFRLDGRRAPGGPWGGSHTGRE
jgi:hypothetical protein